MLTITKITSAAAAERYFEGLVHSHSGAEHYYGGRAGGEPAGRWFGASESLGVMPGTIVQPGELGHLLAGESLNGERLVQQTKDHTPGWDCTFSAPKSVSAIWATGDEAVRAEIDAAHEAAVNAALAYLSQRAGFTRRGHAGVRPEHVSLIGTAYEHSTSRNEDPHLHTHGLVANIAQRQDGTWGSLESHPLFINRLAAGSLYQAELAHRLVELGYTIKPGDGGTFAVSGVPTEVTRQWSSRHEQMEVHGQGPAAEWAWAKDRPKKGVIDRPSLFARWQAEAAEHGWTIETIRAIRSGHGQPAELYVDFQHVLRDLTAADSVFSKADLVQHLAAASYGHLDAAAIQTRADRLLAAAGRLHSPFVPAGLADKFGNQTFTTRRHLAIERRMVHIMGWLARPRGKYFGGRAASRRALDTAIVGLSVEQQIAVNVVSGPARLAVITGAAGSGKTAAMRAVREAYQHTGFRVIGLAEANAAARELEKGSGIRSTNVAKFLSDHSRRLDLPNQHEREQILTRVARAHHRPLRWSRIRATAAALAGLTPAELKVVASDQLTRTGAYDPEQAAVGKAAALANRKGMPREASRLAVLRQKAGRAADAWADSKLTGRKVKLPPRRRSQWALNRRTIVVLDEAAMVDTTSLARVAREVRRSGAKLILLGDDQQLQAIGPGGAFAAARDIADAAGAHATLAENRRQQLSHHQTAADHLRRGHVAAALAIYDKEGAVHVGERADLAQQLVQQWADDHVAHPADSQVLLTASHIDGAELNRKAQAELRRRGLLGERVATDLETARQGKQSLYVGDRVLFRANDRQTGVINGDMAVVLGTDAHGRIRTALAGGGGGVAFDPQTYPDWHLAYASTIHKSQGSTVDRCYWLVSPTETREASYVAATRHRKGLHIFIDKAMQQAVTSTRAAVKTERERVLAGASKSLNRQRGKRLALADITRQVTRIGA